MSLHEMLFVVGNLFILPFWLIMIFAPEQAITQRIIKSLLPVMALAALYLIALIASPLVNNTPLDLSAFTTAQGIGTLLGNSAGAATAWLHLIAFDLFVGRWAYLDSREKDIGPTWLVSLTLFFVLMAGPFGLLLYLAVRFWCLRQQ